MILWFATNNVHKKEELEACLKIHIQDITIKIPSQECISFDPQETGSDFIENSLIKARELHKILLKSGCIEPVIADDSGLCVDSLGGRPGVLSARYGIENIASSSGKKPESGMQNLILLDELGDTQTRSARFVCAMVLLFSHDRFTAVQETVEGEIVKKDGIKGELGFGYDPIFYIPEKGLTLAQLSSQEKNKISHRGKAAGVICKHLYGKV